MIVLLAVVALWVLWRTLRRARTFLVFAAGIAVGATLLHRRHRSAHRWL